MSKLFLILNSFFSRIPDIKKGRISGQLDIRYNPSHKYHFDRTFWDNQKPLVRYPRTGVRNLLVLGVHNIVSNICLVWHADGSGVPAPLCSVPGGSWYVPYKMGNYFLDTQYIHNLQEVSYNNHRNLNNILYVQEVVTQPKILNRTILSTLIHVT